MTAADLREFMEFSRKKTMDLLETIAKRPDAATVLAWRPGPGRAPIAWQLMHIAATDDRHLYARMRGGEPNRPITSAVSPAAASRTTTRRRSTPSAATSPTAARRFSTTSQASPPLPWPPSRIRKRHGPTTNGSRSSPGTKRTTRGRPI